MKRKGFPNGIRLLVIGVALGIALPARAESPATVTQVPAATAAETQAEWHAAPTVAAEEAKGSDDSRFYATGEYLYWWIKDSHLPPLVTQGSLNDPQPGGLGQNGTSILFGGGGVDNEERSGGRFTAGFWFTQDHSLGLEASYFFLASRSVNFNAGPGGPPNSVLAVPFINATPGFPDIGVEDAETISAPPDGELGTIGITLSSRLWGAEANLVSQVVRSSRLELFPLVGFRFLELDESLTMNTFTDFRDGSTLSTVDDFSAKNHFYGGQMGARARIHFGNAFVDAIGKVALGDMHESVNVQGGAVATLVGAADEPFPGGILTQPSNQGNHSRDRFAVVPEVGITVGYNFGEHLAAHAGYSFLYCSDVARPGEQIDRTINFLQPRGPSVPVFSLKDTDFWAQGVSCGLSFRY